MRKVLFISHSAGRTGAPIVLLNALRWIKVNTALSFEILLKEDGELRSDFEALAPTHVLSPASPKRLWSKFFPSSDWSAGSDLPEGLLDYYASANIGLIFANTITLGGVLKELESLDCPVITFVHELAHWIEKSGKQNLSHVKKLTDHFLAASKAVQNHLVLQIGINPGKTSVVHEFIPVKDCVAEKEQVDLIKKSLGISGKDFIVIGSGYETWRKGKDLFVQVAHEVVSSGKDSCHFIWVGGWEGKTKQLEIEALIKNYGLIGKVHFVGQVNNPIDYFACGDIFAMVSREDPYPLVCLEAASLGLPVLCFSDAGGMPEFVEDDAGFILPHMDTSAMAKSVMLLQNDRGLLSRLGCRAAEKVRSQHDVSIGASALVKVIADL